MTVNSTECHYIDILEATGDGAAYNSTAKKRASRDKCDARLHVGTALVYVAAIIVMWRISIITCTSEWHPGGISLNIMVTVQTCCYAMSLTCAVWSHNIRVIKFAVCWHLAMVMWLADVQIKQDPTIFAILLTTHAAAALCTFEIDDKHAREEDGEERSIQRRAHFTAWRQSWFTLQRCEYQG